VGEDGHRPPRVDIPDVGYTDAPPGEVSPRCAWWLERFAAGWRPNRRIRAMGYEEATHWYGVYTSEYFDKLRPLYDAPITPALCP